MVARTRIAVAAVGGLVVSLLLFWLMQKMIAVAERAPERTDPPATLDKIRLRPLTPPPPPASARVEAEPRSAPPPNRAASDLPAVPAPAPDAARDLPAYAPPLGLRGAPGGLGEHVDFAMADPGLLRREDGWEDDFDGRKTVPIASIRPRYPAQAAANGIEGWVEMVFTIGANGRVKDIRIIAAHPQGVFEEAAAAALAKWLFAPLYVSGRPVTREATQRFDFTRADIDALHLLDR